MTQATSASGTLTKNRLISLDPFNDMPFSAWFLEYWMTLRSLHNKKSFPVMQSPPPPPLSLPRYLAVSEIHYPSQCASRELLFTYSTYSPESAHVAHTVFRYTQFFCLFFYFLLVALYSFSPSHSLLHYTCARLCHAYMFTF